MILLQARSLREDCSQETGARRKFATCARHIHLITPKKGKKTMKTKTAFLLALALALIPLLGRATGPFQAAQGSDVQTASVGQIPTDIVLDEAGGKLYIANFGSGAVRSVQDQSDPARVSAFYQRSHHCDR
ncbi:MAG TPA: hypothetical protein ENJ31_07000 [Anaerolineae bacterium]|nr:hypothetical protein [Anaerolineae bacterium]